ncbi:MAG: cation transporter [Actinomycetota bacterium]|jgi:copper chaperone|nr:cation transporter [Actinomycetota bacterium]
MIEKTFNVPDMSCGHCKAAVEAALNKRSGVERANADIVKGTVEVSYDEGTVTTEDLLGAIEESGYTVAA